MCGRYSIYDVNEFIKRFGVKNLPKMEPIYNAAPSMQLPIITNHDPDKVTMAKWGLIPSWAKDESLSYKMINARAETVHEKAAYKTPFQAKRCLIPVNSFFEWKHEGGSKVPYVIRMKDKQMFALAGIWDTWGDVISFSIITTDANHMMEKIHDRMPVILERADEKTWLEKPDKSILHPFQRDGLEYYQVSSDVNSPKNNTADILNKLTTLDAF